MGRTLAAGRAELHLLETLGRRLLVASRGVVTLLAFATSQNREITHCLIPSSGVSSEPARRPRPTTFGRANGQASHRRLVVIT